ncbi:Spy0128 family protein [Enterocloster lavalensis]|uniref:Spy0128 family protein n=1 Tax=Enterocloster lavalensis TaxID=460384 RepID=UPI00267362F4|nr:FctA domain-containing protein [Hungatella hathewayi]
MTLTATKTMDGLIPTGSGFTFFLDDANGQRLQVKNNQGGNITFDTLTFDKTGTYVYYLTEQTGNDKNVNYDTSSYKVTVTVTCPYDYAASVSYEKNGQAYNSVPAFANTTKPSASAPTPTQTPPVVAPARPLDNVPKTEDSSNLALWGILAAASLLSLTVLLAGTKTRKVRSQSKEHQS